MDPYSDFQKIPGERFFAPLRMTLNRVVLLNESEGSAFRIESLPKPTKRKKTPKVHVAMAAHFRETRRDIPQTLKKKRVGSI
jgi:hypothetical protein